MLLINCSFAVCLIGCWTMTGTRQEASFLCNKEHCSQLSYNKANCVLIGMLAKECGKCLKWKEANKDTFTILCLGTAWKQNVFHFPIISESGCSHFHLTLFTHLYTGFLPSHDQCTLWGYEWHNQIDQGRLKSCTSLAMICQLYGFFVYSVCISNCSLNQW